MCCIVYNSSDEKFLEKRSRETIESEDKLIFSKIYLS